MTALAPEVDVPALVADCQPEILRELTARQRRFVEEYLVDCNARQAAIRAGYSERSAGNQGYDNLRIPKIVDAISAVMAKQSERTGIDRKWVLAELVDAHNKIRDKDATAPTVAARAKVLELIGKHVDVRAFRAGVGFGGGDDDELPLWDLSRLDDEEFEVFERLLAKVAVTRPSAEGARAEATAPGPGAPSQE